MVPVQGLVMSISVMLKVMNNFVAVGDYEGYVHLMSQVDGRFVGRVRVDNKGIRAPMQSRGNTLYVFGNSGNLAALSVE